MDRNFSNVFEFLYGCYTAATASIVRLFKYIKQLIVKWRNPLRKTHWWKSTSKIDFSIFQWTTESFRYKKKFFTKFANKCEMIPIECSALCFHFSFSMVHFSTRSSEKKSRGLMLLIDSRNQMYKKAFCWVERQANK